MIQHSSKSTFEKYSLQCIQEFMSSITENMNILIFDTLSEFFVNSAGLRFKRVSL